MTVGRINPAGFADTHAHLDTYGSELEPLLGRARAAGVDRLVVFGVDQRTSRFALDLVLRALREGRAAAGEWPNLALAMGLHPHYASRSDRELPALHDLLAEAIGQQLPVAIGETGLDYFRDRSPRPLQRASFWAHVDLVHELRVPLVVHDRDAHDDVLAVLRAASPLPAGGVMHCYSGDLAMAEECLQLGLHISLAGPVTFPKAHDLRQIAARVPLDRLLVETDCPYMAPEPYRGKTNEPAYVAYTARAVAAARPEPDDAVLDALTANAQRLFWRAQGGVETALTKA